MLTKIPHLVDQVMVTEGIHGSDHEAASLVLKSTRPNIPRCSVFNFKRGDFVKLQGMLSIISRDICFITELCLGEETVVMIMQTQAHAGLT